jgi:hypothetical protein
MELVSFGEELTVDLQTPQCDLEYDKCTGVAEVFYDVHGCAQYYACGYCDRVLAATMLHSFIKYEKLECKVCGKMVSLPGYVKIVKLKEENNAATA